MLTVDAEYGRMTQETKRPMSMEHGHGPSVELTFITNECKNDAKCYNKVDTKSKTNARQKAPQHCPFCDGTDYGVYRLYKQIGFPSSVEFTFPNGDFVCQYRHWPAG